MLRQISLFFLCIGLLLAGTPVGVYQGELSLLRLRQQLEPLLYLQDEELSVVFWDLASEKGLSVNGSKAMNPASVIKLPILVEAYRQIQKGEVSVDEQLVLKKGDYQQGSGTLRYQPVGTKTRVKELMQLMIGKSDNTATKLLIDYVGKERLNKGFQEMGMRQTSLGSTNLLKAEGLNYASANDIAELLIKINMGAFISPKAKEELLQLLSSQVYKWGIPRYLPRSITVANKTGTLRHVSHDVGVVFHEAHPYILVIFVSNVQSYQKARQLIASISQKVYRWVDK